MRFQFAFLAFGLLVGVSTTRAVVVKSNPAGQELAADLRNAQPEKNSEISGVLKIHSPSGRLEIPVHAKATTEDGRWKTIYTTTATNNVPAYKIVVIHTTNSPNQYMVAEAKNGNPLQDPVAIDNKNAHTVFLAGSDFSLADLGLEFLHWPEQNRLMGELRLGRDCYLLESQNPDAGEMVRVKSWIDKESNGVLVAEGYNAKNELVKRFSLSGSSFKKVNGQWQLEKMTIYSPKKKSETVLQFDLPKN